MKKTKETRKSASKGESPKAPLPEFLSREERLVAGKALRDAVPRESHASWKRPAKRRDPVAILDKSNQDRVPELVPIRYGRMLRNPFAFLRGSAGLMAHDLAITPNTGIRVQACGDCHLLNFGLSATPGRNLVFDINDFDETLSAPWEWDIKRLAVSFAVAARDNQLADKDARDAADECARAYREHMWRHSKMGPLEIWYDRIDAQSLIEMAPNAKSRARREQLASKARRRIAEYLVPKITGGAGERRRLVDQPPLLYHPAMEDAEGWMRDVLNGYRSSLAGERRRLFDGYHLEDFAMKVVGIGSVGTRCFVALFYSPEQHPLLLQFKEACPSVLEPYAGKSPFKNNGERVVMGQRLTQTATDIFLGWTRGRRGRDYHVRQLRDMKMSFATDKYSAPRLKRYAELCGRILARTHAKSGDAALISGYLGKSDTFDRAIGKFALTYADQNDKDYAAQVAAVKSGRMQALVEEDL